MCVCVCVRACVRLCVCVGEHAELQRQESADTHSFQQGDKVKCLLEVDILRQMQEGHGGWNPKMAEVKISCVHFLINVDFMSKKIV